MEEKYFFLKHELQVQMMNLKAELEKQLASQKSVAEPENDEVSLIKLAENGLKSILLKIFNY